METGEFSLGQPERRELDNGVKGQIAEYLKSKSEKYEKGIADHEGHKSKLSKHGGRISRVLAGMKDSFNFSYDPFGVQRDKSALGIVRKAQDEIERGETDTTQAVLLSDLARSTPELYQYPEFYESLSKGSRKEREKITGLLKGIGTQIPTDKQLNVAKYFGAHAKGDGPDPLTLPPEIFMDIYGKGADSNTVYDSRDGVYFRKGIHNYTEDDFGKVVKADRHGTARPKKESEALAFIESNLASLTPKELPQE